MELNEKQREAVEYLEGPLLVLAGPGTGKTQLLSEKVAYILKNTDTSPENILCLTFTETGASNMRERLKTIVGKDGLKVNIGTYHAFGSDILAQYKNYSEDYDRRLDAAIDEVTQFKIIKEIQDSLSGTDILRGDNVKDIVSTISSAKSAGLNYGDLEVIAEKNTEDAEVLSKAISPLLKNVIPRAFKESYENAYLPIFELLKDYIDSKPIVKGVERSISGLTRDLKAAISDALASNKITPLSAWRNEYFEKDSRGDYRLKERIANKKLHSLSNVMKKYDEKLKKDGLYDFDDMIMEASRVLREDEGFRLTLSERYQFIMLDEFQDTNPSQFSIIKQLTDYEKPLIMAVGDDDQAIYEFQGALSTNLTDFQAHYKANVIALTENYRSTQEILDFSRQIINQAPDRFADKELSSHKPSSGKSDIHRVEFLTSEMEYAFIADKISELIKNGVPLNEIAVISYKRKYFLPLLPFLKAKPEIKIAYEEQNNLLEDDKIHQIITISRYIYELANEKRTDTSILEILAYPFFNLPILDVLRVVDKAKREKHSVFEELSASGITALTEVAAFFGNLVAKSFNEPLEVFLDYLIGALELDGYRSPFLEYYTKEESYETLKLYENLSALKGKLRKHFGEKSLRLSDLITLIDDYETAEMSLNVTSPYRDADESVQILTAHKAKGLEFEYVFIISADHVAWGKGKGNNNLLVLPRNLAYIRHTGTTDGEKLRILYVALTRAKHGLYITNSLRDFNDKSPERLEYLDEYVENNEVISPFLPDKKVTLKYEASAPEIAASNLKNWFSPYYIASPDLRSIYKERVSNFKMSATALISFIDIVYAGPEAFFKSYILQVPREPENESIAFGNLVHKTFEMVTNNHLSDEDAIKLFLEELDKADLPVEIAQKLREKGPADLKIALSKFGPLLREGQSEVNVGVEKLSVNGIPITGKVDHIHIDKENKTIEIYDYKTGNFHKERWQSHLTLYKYMLQLCFYKLLLNNSPTYAKYKIKRAHILFVVPDRDGEVYDKVYDFDEKDEDELLKLMQAVYNQVSSLRFLDDKELMISPDNNRNLKDIKEFIALLLAKNTSLE